MIYEILGEAIAAFLAELFDGFRGRRHKRRNKK